MVATLSRVITDRLGNELIIIHPDFDRQLTNVPQFQAKGTNQQYDLPYRGWTSPRDFLVQLQAKVSAAGRATLAALIQKRIDLIDACIQLETDRALYNSRVEQWPSPTQAQQLLINAALAKVTGDLQTVQDIRDSIAALIAQIP